MPGVSRRRALAGAGAAAGGVLIAGCGGQSGQPRQPPPARPVTLPEPVSGLPAGQHFWDATLREDEHGNRIQPRHHRLLFFVLGRAPALADARALEAALRTLEGDYPYGPDGLLTAVGWGPSWFGAGTPVPAPVALSGSEVPELEDWVAVIHLAADRPGPLAAAERLLAGASPALLLRQRRAGSVGPGLARRIAARTALPEGVAPPPRAPFLMGFASGHRRTQATEPAVTVAAGRWAGSTTMHVSRIALTLPSWYRALSDDERAAQMFGPGVSAAEARAAGPGLDPVTTPLASSARRQGRVGHAQAAAKARRDGKPLLLRRDFNGEADGAPLTHFVSYQADIEDFVTTRKAVNAHAAIGVGGVDAAINNGINEWLSVQSRANFLVPPRARRAFPGLAGWDRT